MICENCGKEYNGTYGSGRFCSKKCARSFSTKNSQGQLKEAKCIDCGKLIYIGKRASLKTCRCEECKSKIKFNKFNKCKICGQLYNIHIGCQNEFCKNHDIQQFKSLIEYFGFDKTKLGTLEVENEFNRIRDILYHLYYNDCLNCEEISRIYKYKNPCNLSGKIFRYLNIPFKGFSKAIVESYIKGISKVSSNNIFYKSWHTTWNGKEVYLRSSYELDYAKELDKQKIDYDVECLRIKYWDSQKQKFRCAIPDFYILSQNLIVEIKSEYTLDKQNMIDKMKAYKDLGYNFKLICDHKEMKI